MTAPTGLTTDFSRNPIGVDTQQLTFRWRMDTDRRGAKQVAARVRLGRSVGKLTDDETVLWDTGKLSTDRPAVSYDGPTLDPGERYHWTVRIWDETGTESAWSEPGFLEPGPSSPADWEATWIHRPFAEENSEGQFSYFRRSITIEEPVERARAYITACHQYELSINGTEIDRGPAYSYPDHQYYRTVDITESLTPGENVIGIRHTWNGAGQGRPEGKPGVLCQLEVRCVDDSEHQVVTDSDWATLVAPWRGTPDRNGEIAEPVEVIDGRDEPVGWNEPGFDATAWPRAEPIGRHPQSPWTSLHPQLTEIEHNNVEPTELRWLDDETLVVDFGKLYAGVPVVLFEDGTAGHRVEMHAGNRLEADGSVATTEGTQWTDMGYGYIQRDGDQRFQPFNYLGFRYLQIDVPGEHLVREQLWLRARHTHIPDERAGRIETSNETINEIVELARHSALYASQEGFIDTPTREKGQFLQDGANISSVTTRAFNERQLTRRAIEEFVRSHYRYWEPEGRVNAIYPNGDGKRDIPEFTVGFPAWLWAFYRVSDDRDLLKLAYPVVRAIGSYIARHIDPETGLITELSGGAGGPYENGIVDWPPEMRYGYDRDWPVRTTVNILCVNSLRRIESIAAALDRPAHERRSVRTRRRQLETAIVDRLFDGELFVDGCDGEQISAHRSQHANALALAVGLVPAEDTDVVADYVETQDIRMGPMMVHWLLDALGNRPDTLVDLLTDRSNDGWAAIIEEGGTFTWESWHCYNEELPANERTNRSESHAMGATVYTAIQQQLLGIRITAPRALTIEVPAGGLERASGRVPTGCGPLTCAYERHSGGVTVTVTVPWNTTVTLTIPAAVDAPLTIDNQRFEADDSITTVDGVVESRHTDGRVEFKLCAGTYTVSVD
ncbi:family 78 glycoside hydrolase catalytic domain [Halocatena halophila]|uniref:family 78 glycoside hydrolase catalytic domain n=1 Tax=Halocatena halophila TaxID=2814576 RepID=UPI002ED53862